MRTKGVAKIVVLAALLGGALVSVAQSAPAPAGSEAPPKFTFDGAWPKLPPGAFQGLDLVAGLTAGVLLLAVLLLPSRRKRSAAKFPKRCLPRP